MSSGGPIEDRDLGKLAPRFREAVEAALHTCAAAGLDAIVWEAYRSNELQALYYLRGRPPSAEYPKPVTNAKTNLYSWHGYCLAVDVISQKSRWFRGREAEGVKWFARVAAIFAQHGCDWGGDWIGKRADPPHFQWGRLKPSPSDRAREILASEGMEAVWLAVGAG